MKAGRELDALVAKHVFDTTLRNITETSCELRHGDKWHSCGPCAHYSTNIADAWEVVRKMGMVLIENSGEAFGKLDEWNVQFVGHDKEGEPHWVSESAETVELAICLAALKAVSQEEQG